MDGQGAQHQKSSNSLRKVEWSFWVSQLTLLTHIPEWIDSLFRQLWHNSPNLFGSHLDSGLDISKRVHPLTMCMRTQPWVSKDHASELIKLKAQSQRFINTGGLLKGFHFVEHTAPKPFIFTHTYLNLSHTGLSHFAISTQMRTYWNNSCTLQWIV